VIFLGFSGFGAESTGGLTVDGQTASPAPATKKPVRMAAAQAKRRSIDWRLKDAGQALEAVDKNLAELEHIVQKAGEGKCDALALPEDTLGLLEWFGVNQEVAKDVLPVAVERMLKRLASAAAKHRMYLVVCSDYIESDGGVYNTAFLLGRDGKEIGRYHK
jgi:apolipoprotein N-acyltransferase